MDAADPPLTYFLEPGMFKGVLEVKLDPDKFCRPKPTEFVCEDCMEGDHDHCHHEGGWPFQDTNERCGCHLTDHAFDNRNPTKRTACRLCGKNHEWSGGVPR